ncbi:hypothetical protein [Chryseobacterium daeguense]|uniref:hypothetical protein n=1 Tax=Chryseobacterium daeguense TaxID=412438 RepID=UPI000421E941|nr:hypothetical protein [Chryseobacterium daeguense]
MNVVVFNFVPALFEISAVCYLQNILNTANEVKLFYDSTSTNDQVTEPSQKYPFS